MKTTTYDVHLMRDYMSNDLVQSKTFDINCGFNEEQVRILRTLINGQISTEQMHIFLMMCRRTGLDPFAKQIYAIPRRNKHTNKTELTIQTSIDGFRLVADRTGCYAPGRPTEFVWDNGKLVCATAFVKKMASDGSWHEVSACAYMAEYYPSFNDQFWKKMPAVMLEKCAEARALRRAFPQDLQGIYAKEEMDQAQDDNRLIMASIEDDEPRISHDQARSIDEFLNGYEDIRQDLLNVCKVSSIKDIKTKQLNACRTFVLERVKMKKSLNDDKK
jgi:phage recombination protein Bet